MKLLVDRHRILVGYISSNANKKQPQYFYSGNTRLGQNTILAYDLFFSTSKYILENITDNPHRKRGEIEDIQHYLLNSNLFKTCEKNFLFTTYCQPTLYVLLYGNSNLSELENKTISS